MKKLTAYINEFLVNGKTLFRTDYTFTPKTKLELSRKIQSIFRNFLENNDNKNVCDLNFIDTSYIESFDNLFSDVEISFKIDISKWDTRNVKSMCRMFAGSNIDCDISKWYVSKVIDFSNMFKNSSFNHNLSNWKPSINKKPDVTNMFKGCPIENNPPKWYNEIINN